MDESFDSGQVQSDITRIREKLKRLDAERKAAVEQLQQAMARADATMARREPPTEGAGPP
jgi:hypothetical protein